MADSLAETLTEVKRDQAKNLHDLEVLRIRLHLVRLDHQSTLLRAGNDPGQLAVLRTAQQVVIPRLQDEIKRLEEAAKRWKARVHQISALLAWEIDHHEELQTIQEPVYFV